MTNEEYLSLWDQNDDSRTFVVLKESPGVETVDKDYGNIVVPNNMDAWALLERGIQNGDYPTGCFLVEITEDAYDYLDCGKE